MDTAFSPVDVTKTAVAAKWCFKSNQSKIMRVYNVKCGAGNTIIITIIGKDKANFSPAEVVCWTELRIF